MTVPPPNVYFNDSFTATKKAAYNNVKASLSKRPLTPSQTQQPPLPSTSSCLIEEFRQWMEDTCFRNDFHIETKGTPSNAFIILYEAMQAQTNEAQRLKTSIAELQEAHATLIISVRNFKHCLNTHNGEGHQ